MIEGGYYIKARKIQDSEIAHAPPHVREIWDWLIKEVNHSGTGKYKRGETIRSLKDIQDGLCWYVGYRKEKYSKSKCEMAMNWLRKRTMIETTKTIRGMFITVCNYDIYQNPKNYETNNEGITKTTRKQQTHDTINKNVKNDYNEKNNKKKNIDFEVFWNLYDKKRGKKDKIEVKWYKLTKEIQQKIIDYIPKYIESQPDKKFRKDPETFLNNESWNDELIGEVDKRDQAEVARENIAKQKEAKERLESKLKT